MSGCMLCENVEDYGLASGGQILGVPPLDALHEGEALIKAQDFDTAIQVLDQGLSAPSGGTQLTQQLQELLSTAQRRAT